MKILVVGNSEQLAECTQKLGDHDYTHYTSHVDATSTFTGAELIFDFLISEKPEAFKGYADKRVTVFANTWRYSLSALSQGLRAHMQCTAFGFNGFPTMFNREMLEVALLNNEGESVLAEICAKLKIEYLIVDDRPGLVTPRVICMIINEAYYTVQDGTATRADIDLAMKLGTNYPYGPFEWCQKIGLKNVYRLLEAVYDDTKDERYKISALMKKEYLSL